MITPKDEPEVARAKRRAARKAQRLDARGLGERVGRALAIVPKLAGEF